MEKERCKQRIWFEHDLSVPCLKNAIKDEFCELHRKGEIR